MPLNPDPGAADENTTVLLSGKTFNAIRNMTDGKWIVGAIDQIDVNPAGNVVNISFASEKLVTIIQNGAAVDVLIPMRNVIA